MTALRIVLESCLGDAMKLNSLDEAIKDYEAITGEDFEWNSDYENLIVLPDNSFMTWRIGEYDGYRYFEIRQTYGFVKNFIDRIKKIMSENNVEYIVTSTQRSPKAHIRKWKMTHLMERDYSFEGRNYHVLLGHINNLK